jgi:hypothetical protein
MERRAVEKMQQVEKVLIKKKFRVVSCERCKLDRYETWTTPCDAAQPG